MKPGMAEMPPATVEVNDALVRCLLRDQRPDLADRPVVRVANGWDNTTYRPRALRAGVSAANNMGAGPRRQGLGRPPTMLHGDLHPGNILLADDGSLAGVIDFGDVGAGDPAVDMAVGWLMFDAGARRRFTRAFGPAVDADTWARAPGWALNLSTAMLGNSDDNPRMFAVAKALPASGLFPDGRHRTSSLRLPRQTP